MKTKLNFPVFNLNDEIPLHQDIFLQIKGEHYLTKFSNNSCSVGGGKPKEIKKIIKQHWLKIRGKNQLLKFKRYCDFKGLVFSKEYKKAKHLIRPFYE